MTKAEAAEKLKAKGYDAYVFDGVVMVVSDENIGGKVRAELAGMGYNASYGITNVLKKKESK